MLGFIFITFTQMVFITKGPPVLVFDWVHMLFEKIFLEKKKNLVKYIWKTLTLLYSFICNKKAVKTKWFKSHLENKN